MPPQLLVDQDSRLRNHNLEVAHHLGELVEVSHHRQDAVQLPELRAPLVAGGKCVARQTASGAAALEAVPGRQLLLPLRPAHVQVQVRYAELLPWLDVHQRPYGHGVLRPRQAVVPPSVDHIRNTTVVEKRCIGKHPRASLLAPACRVIVRKDDAERRLRLALLGVCIVQCPKLRLALRAAPRHRIEYLQIPCVHIIKCVIQRTRPGCQRLIQH
mmetsp:Transcript_19570/g.50188  ORF Transcript_19570/g.50188 Transcript_19570/m.50188 type:complete len:214 (-) Transcript_19570:411-1052(-)